MSFACPVLPVEDVLSVEKFFQEVFGCRRVQTIGDRMVELQIGGTAIKLFLVEYISLPGTSLGGSVTIPVESIGALHSLADRHGHNAIWMCNGYALMVEGPCGVVVISFCSEAEDSNAKRSFMDIMTSHHAFIAQRPNAPSPHASPSPVKKSHSNVTISPSRYSYYPVIDNFNLFVNTIAKGSSPRCQFEPNSRQSISFENDFFVGEVLFIVRTKPLDPCFKHFFESNKDRLFVIQLQGKFKRAPLRSSSILMGVETIGPPCIGMMTKNILKGIIKLGNKKLKGNNAIQYSFGSSKGQGCASGSCAHAAVPLLIAADKFCVTEAGSRPPDIMREFQETKFERSQRRKNPDSLTIDVHSTYSITFKGSNIDFCEWSTSGFYMMKPLCLSSFLGPSNGFRVVAYCSEGMGTDHSDASKPSRGTNYFLELDVRASTGSPLETLHVERELRYDDDDEEVEEEDFEDCNEAMDKIQAAMPSIDIENKAPAPSPTMDTMNWTHEDMKYCPAGIEIDDYRRGRRRRVAYVVQAPGYSPRLRSYMQVAEHIPMLMMPEDGSEGRLSEMELRRRQIATSIKTFMLRCNNQNSQKASNALHSLFKVKTELDDFFLRKTSPHSNERNVSNNELPAEVVPIRNRHSLSSIDAPSLFTSMPSGAINQRKSSSETSSQKVSIEIARSLRAVRMEGAVAVCTGRRSWSEEWMVLNGQFLEIFEPQAAGHLRLSSNNKIYINQINAVAVLTKDKKPFAGDFEFFFVGTISRVYYFCVKSKEVLDMWLTALLSFEHPRHSIAEDIVDSQVVSEICSGFPSLGGEVSEWEEPEACAVRVGNYSKSAPAILNMRKTAFFAADESEESVIDPLALSKRVLRRIQHICNPSAANFKVDSVSPQASNSSAFEWVDFSDDIVLLQTISLLELSRDELIAFFINVYHTLLTHAFIMYGIPSRALTWRALKRDAAYEIAGDLISLRDIDEVILGNSCNQVVVLNLLRNCISCSEAMKQCEKSRNKWLRSGVLFPTARLHMGRQLSKSSIRSILSMRSISQSELMRDSFSLESVDWRLALSVNSGCCEVSNEVMVFEGNRLDSQLDRHCHALLFRLIQIDLSAPTLLNQYSPSLTLPLALSSLLLDVHSKSTRLIPSSTLQQASSVETPLFWIRSVEDLLNSALSSSVGDEVAIKEKLRRLREVKKLAESRAVHVLFKCPGYDSFRYMKLSSRDIVDESDASVEVEPVDTSPAKGRYEAVTSNQSGAMRSNCHVDSIHDSKRVVEQEEESCPTTIVYDEKCPQTINSRDNDYNDNNDKNTRKHNKKKKKKGPFSRLFGYKKRKSEVTGSL